MTTISSRRNQEPLYNVNKTIRKVQEIADITPLRLFKVFYPLYSISIAGTHYTVQPFEFIEKYIESYLEACKTATAQELADFFGLRLSMVEKILHVLIAIKHIIYKHDHYELAQLGKESLDENQKRIGDNQWGQKLLFDAYFLEPLPRALSSESKMHIKDQYEVWTIANTAYRYDSYACLARQAPWEDRALDKLQLLKGKERKELNLPDEIIDLRKEALELVYMPMHIVVASKHSANSPATRYYIPFTNTTSMRDTFFEHLINKREAGHLNYIQATLNEEDTIENLNDFWEKWQRDSKVTGGELERLPNGTWQVNVIAADVHASNSKIPLKRIGSYWTEKGYFIRIWSKDETLRREAAFENIISTIRRNSEALTFKSAQQLLARNAKSLQTEALDFADLQRYAQAQPDYDDIVQALENVDEAPQ